MTREEELQILKEYIEKNGVVQLPPDERGPEYASMSMSVWRKSRGKRGRKKKVVTEEGKKE